MELRRLTFMAERARAILHAAGVAELLEEYGSYDFFNATHVFGTCRMGRDPATSVVDADGRGHRWRNLFMCDASVLPSSGGGEAPSLTIEALGLRTGGAAGGRSVAERSLAGPPLPRAAAAGSAKFEFEMLRQHENAL